jgi:transglutaminase-like putative cysteine protease
VGVSRRLVLAGAAAAALALAAAAAGRVYHGSLFELLMAGAAVGSVGIGLLLARRPQWMVAPVSVLAMLGYVVFAVWWSARAAGVTGNLPVVLVDAVRNGGPRLLTALIPVEAQPDTVLLPLVLVWVAGLVSVELAVRAGRVPLSLIPPTAVYLGALIFAGPHGGAEAWRALAYVALAATMLAAGTPRAPISDPMATNLPARQRAPLRNRLRLRAAAGLLLFVALAAAVVPVVALGLPNQPLDPRAAISPPQSDTLDENPLARISGWMQNPGQQLFDVNLSADSRITLAVLSDFNGVTWTIGATYREAGHQLPAPSAAPGAQAPASTRRITQAITVKELTGRLVPAVSAPREVDGIRVDYDLGSGTVLREDGMRPGLSYSVVSGSPSVEVNQLPTAEAPSGPSVARFLQVGSSVPTELQKLAETIGTGNAGAYQKAFALQQFMAEHYTFVTDAPSGHAYPNLKFFLLSPRNAGGQRGTSEQFAAAFAALGRLMGLPTRVVVGFSAPAGAHTVYGAQALAWPEVLFSDIGWVSFNPMPDKGVKARPLEQDYRPTPDPPTPSNPPTSLAPVLPSNSASASAAAVVAHRAAALPPWAPWAAGGALLGLTVLAEAAAVLARRARSARRLRQGPPSDRVRGAWLEVLDALRLGGRPPPDHFSVTEVAAWAARPDRKGRPLPRLDALAELANMVGFGPEWADDTDATAATEQARHYVRALRAGLAPWRRVVWVLHPGPLRWRHGSPARPAAPLAPPGQLRPAAPNAG